MTRPRVLVTGVTGLLGSAVARIAGGRFDVHGVARHADAVALGCVPHHADIADLTALRAVIDATRPDVVIHAAAIASVDACEREPARAARVNVEGTANVVLALGDRDARLVFISTDSVFDGTRGDYTEDDPPAPGHVYARTKLEAERVVLAARPDALVVRTCFYGWNALPQASLAEWILHRLESGLTVPGFTDVRFTPLVSDELARVLLEAAATTARGVLHVGSRDGVSKYAFACRVADAFGFPVERVVPVGSDSVALTPVRPKDVTLRVARAAALLGRELPSVADGIAEFQARRPRADVVAS